MRAASLFVFLFSQSLIGYCQRYVGEASIPKITKDGYYKIAIPPEINDYLSPGFTNLRIVDNADQEIPYIIKEEVPIRQTEKFQEYELQRIKNKKSTELILKNPDRKSINNIHLKIRNAEVTKEATLLGSDDHQNWFALKEKFDLFPINGGNGTYEMKLVEFPLSNYLFYSLRISDSLTAPINILTAGYYDANTETGQFTTVPGKVTYSNDGQKKQSYLKLSFDTLQYVDRIDLSMKGSQPYFLRRASLAESRERKLKKRKKQKYQYTLDEFEISSTHPTQIDTKGSRFQEIQIVIENDDDTPLELVSFTALQVRRYVITWLSSSKEYQLKIGKRNLPSPSYDLRFFTDSIPKQIESIAAGPVQINKKKETPYSFSFFTTKKFIWAAVIIVVLLLAYLSMKMVKEMGK